MGSVWRGWLVLEACLALGCLLLHHDASAVVMGVWTGVSCFLWAVATASLGCHFARFGAASTFLFCSNGGSLVYCVGIRTCCKLVLRGWSDGEAEWGACSQRASAIGRLGWGSGGNNYA